MIVVPRRLPRGIAVQMRQGYYMVLLCIPEELSCGNTVTGFAGCQDSVRCSRSLVTEKERVAMIRGEKNYATGGARKRSGNLVSLLCRPGKSCSVFAPRVAVGGGVQKDLSPTWV